MIYLFDNQEALIRVVPQAAIKTYYQTQKLTDSNYISERLEVEIKDIGDLADEVEYVAIPAHEDRYKFHYYFVAQRHLEHDILRITGVDSGIEELSKTIIEDFRPHSRDLRFIAGKVVEHTNWTIGFVADRLGTISKRYYYKNAFEVLIDACIAFGVEAQFFVEINGNTIGNRYIDFKRRTGKNQGKRVVYGHNALSIIKEDDSTGVVTALIGRGRGVQISEAGDIGTMGHELTQAGYSRKIEFDDITWSKANGDPVDKPKGQNYVEIPEATAKHGIKTKGGNRAKMGVAEFDVEQEDVLLRRTYETLIDICKPKTLFATTSLYLPGTHIGDTVRVVRHDKHLYYEARVIEIEWDRLSGQATRMLLGTQLSQSARKTMGNVIQAANAEAMLQVGEMMDRLTSADGKNTNFYTDYEPENPRVGDLWFKPDPREEGQYIIMMWNGEMWEELVSSSINKEIEAEITRLDKEAAQAKKEIEAQQALNAERMKAFDLSLDQFKKEVDAMDWLDPTKADSIINESKLLKLDLDQIRGNIRSNTGEIGAINTKLGDKTGDFWGEIIANSRGMIQSFHDTTTTSAITQSAQALESKIDNKMTGQETRILQAVDGVKVNVKDNADAISNLTLTARGLRSDVSDLESGQSSLAQTARGLRSEINALDGRHSSLTQTVTGINSRVNGLNNSYSSLSQTVSGLRSTVSSNQSDTNSRFTQLSNLIKTRVTSGDVMSIIEQNARSISLKIAPHIDGRMSGEEIATELNLLPDHIRLKGELIHLDGKSKIDDAVITNAMIKDVSASKLTAGEINANRIRVTNIDAANITSGHAKLLTALFDGVNTSLKITGRDINIVRRDGQYSTRFKDNGIELWRDGNHIGSLKSLNAIDDYGFYNNKKSISLTTEPGSYISLSYWDASIRSYVRSLALGWDGKLRLHGSLYQGTSNRGLKLESTTVGSTPVTGFVDTLSGGGIYISGRREVWISLTNGTWLSYQHLYDRLKDAEASIENLQKAVPAAEKPAKTRTPTTTPNTSKIRVGDTVKIRSGVTHYYDQNDRSVRIPTDLWGRNYRELVYVVGYIAPQGRVAPYRLEFDNTIIAWATGGMLIKQ